MNSKSRLKDIARVSGGGISMDALREHVLEELRLAVLDVFTVEEMRLRRHDILHCAGRQEIQRIHRERVVIDTFGIPIKEHMALYAAKAFLPDLLFIEQCVAM